jgi:hypothetical protein
MKAERAGFHPENPAELRWHRPESRVQTCPFASYAKRQGPWFPAASPFFIGVVTPNDRLNGKPYFTTFWNSGDCSRAENWLFELA